MMLMAIKDFMIKKKFQNSDFVRKEKELAAIKSKHSQSLLRERIMEENNIW